MSIVSGIRSGLRVGLRSGINPSSSIDVPTAGPASVYFPTTADHWTLLGLPVPTCQWDCTVASGDLTALIGAVDLTANATPLYGQSITGWPATYVGTADGTASQGFRTSSATLDPAAGSLAWLVYLSFTSGTLNRRLFCPAGDNDRVSSGSTGGGLGRPATVHGNVLAHAAGDHAGITTVRPYLWYRNATGNLSGTFTNLESIVGTHDETNDVGSVKALGLASAALAADTRYVLAAAWVGANAITVASKNTLTTLGWSISY